MATMPWARSACTIRRPWWTAPSLPKCVTSMARSWDRGTGQPGRHDAYRSCAVTVLIDAANGSTCGWAVTGGDGGRVVVTAAGSGAAEVVGATVVDVVVVVVVEVDVEVVVEVVVASRSAVPPPEVAQPPPAATASTRAPTAGQSRRDLIRSSVALARVP